jgi:hypothetical protein
MAEELFDALLTGTQVLVEYRNQLLVRWRSGNDPGGIQGPDR